MRSKQKDSAAIGKSLHEASIRTLFWSTTPHPYRANSKSKTPRLAIARVSTRMSNHPMCEHILGLCLRAKIQEIRVCFRKGRCDDIEYNPTSTIQCRVAHEFDTLLARVSAAGHRPCTRPAQTATAKGDTFETPRRRSLSRDKADTVNSNLFFHLCHPLAMGSGGHIPIC